MKMLEVKKQEQNRPATPTTPVSESISPPPSPLPTTSSGLASYVSNKMNGLKGNLVQLERLWAEKEAEFLVEMKKFSNKTSYEQTRFFQAPGSPISSLSKEIKTLSTAISDMKDEIKVYETIAARGNIDRQFFVDSLLNARVPKIINSTLAQVYDFKRLEAARQTGYREVLETILREPEMSDLIVQNPQKVVKSLVAAFHNQWQGNKLVNPKMFTKVIATQAPQLKAAIIGKVEKYGRLDEESKKMLNNLLDSVLGSNNLAGLVASGQQDELIILVLSKKVSEAIYDKCSTVPSAGIYIEKFGRYARLFAGAGQLLSEKMLVTAVLHHYNWTAPRSALMPVL